MSIRDEIRAKVFSSASAQRKSYVLPFFGTEIELRQATVGEITQMIEEGSTGKISLPLYLIRHAYVPDTEEKVFETADLDGLMALPFNSDMSALSDIIVKLSNVQISDAEKNSDATTSSTT